MRVLFVAAFFPPHIVGGAEVSAHELGVGLQDLGVDVEVATPWFDPPGDGRLPVHSMGLGLGRSPDGAAVFDWKNYARPEQQAMLGFRMFARFRRHRPDIVHCHHLQVLPAAALAASRLGAPLVVTARDFDALCPEISCLLTGERVRRDCGFGSLWERCTAERSEEEGMAPPSLRRRTAAVVSYAVARGRGRLLSRADAVVFPSQELRAIYCSSPHFGGAQADGDVSRLHVIPNAVSDGGPSPEPNRSGIVYVGNGSHLKGTGWLLESFSKAASVRPDLRLQWFGRLEPRWDGRVQRTPGVEYFGAVDQQDVPAIYRSALVAVAPSLWPEPFGRGVLEAQEGAAAVVASDIGGHRDLIDHGRTGLLVTRGDANGLAEVLCDLTDRPEWARELGECGRMHATELSRTRAACETYDLYSQVVSNLRPTGAGAKTAASVQHPSSARSEAKSESVQ